MKDLANVLERIDLSDIARMQQMRQNVKSNTKYSIDKNKNKDGKLKSAQKKKRASTQMAMSKGQ